MFWNIEQVYQVFFLNTQVETMMTSLLPNMPDHGTSVASIIFSAFDEVPGEKIISTADSIFFVLFFRLFSLYFDVC